MSVDARKMQELMQEYQRLWDAQPDNDKKISFDQQIIRKQFIEIGFRIGIDEYGNVALYLMDLAHPNVFGNM